MFGAFLDGEIPLAIRFLLALLIVLAVIGVAAWAMRRFGTRRLGGTSPHGRQPRLAVIDFVSVDGRRRLILIRRDNVEHLLMIGGPTDVVVEPNIVHAGVAPHEVPIGRSPGTAEPLAIPLLDKGSRSLPPKPARPAPQIEALPETPAALPRQLHDEYSTPLRRDALAALADELSSRAHAPRESPTTDARPHPNAPRPELRPELRPEPRVEPRPEPRSATQPVAAETPSAADESLADIAHRLGAVLRKPDAALSPVRAPRSSEPKPSRTDAKPSQSKTLSDSLDHDMARLLGRPTKN